MSRLANGLGLRQDLLLEEIDTLSGGQRRRVRPGRIPSRVRTMVLDEPTNTSTCRPAVADGRAERFDGAIWWSAMNLKLLDRYHRQGPHPLDGRQYPRVTKGTLLELLVQLEAT